MQTATRTPALRLAQPRRPEWEREALLRTAQKVVATLRAQPKQRGRSA